MTTWGFIGSGHIGSTVARLALAAGHEVVMSNSRGPDTLADLVTALGPGARAADSRTAASEGDVVVVTVPLGAYREVPVAELDGKVVLDTMNYYPQRDGEIAELESEQTTTSELLQAHLPGSRVVKVFNNIAYVHLAALARPSGSPERSALAIAGDDAEAKATATRLLDEIGYDAYDLGPLSEGWRTQRDTSGYGAMYAVDPAAWFQSAPKQVTADELAAATRRSQRYRDMR